MFVLLTLGVATLLTAAPAQDKASPRSRTFLFAYQTSVTGLPPGKMARIWLPMAPSTEEQHVKIETKDVPPGARLTSEPQYGNEILYVEAKPDAAGTVALS